MAAIDSRRSGALSPLTREGIKDPTDSLRKWISELTGIPIEKVRRRWISKPGTRPSIEEDWCAAGVERVRTHGTPEQRGIRGDLENAESGHAIRISHQSLSCVASFYGPHAQVLADDFREGCLLPQNSSALEAIAGCAVQSVEEEVLHIPDFLYEQWVDRCDVRFTVGRKIERTFGVRTLCAIGEVKTYSDRGSNDTPFPPGI